MPHRVTVTYDPTAPATRNARLSAASDAEGQAPSRILGTAFAIGTPSGPSSDGARYQFNSLPYNSDELLDVVNEHDGWADPIGRLAEPLAVAEGEQLVAANARIFGTSAGRDALVLAAEGVKGGWSIAATFADYTEDGDGVRHVQDPWTAVHLGLVRDPAFTESRGLTLAASAASTETGENMPDAPAAPPAAPAAPPQGAAFGELPTIPELAREIAEFQRSNGQRPVHPLAEFSSHAEFAAAFLGADEGRRRELAAAFAIPGTTTADIPGLMLPAWRTRMIANLDARRPAIAAFGGSIGLPDGGMRVEWPKFDGDLDGLIAKQLAELDELNGVKLTITNGGADILTAGAASSISYQALMRSTPAYLAQYQVIMDAAWARYTEAVFEAAILAASTDAGVLPAIAAGAKPSAFKSLLFDASAKVEDATGAPADVVLASADVWLELGGADLPAPGQGGENGIGSADARSLRVQVSNLEVERAPFLPAGTLIVSNGEAAKFSEQGPMVATEEDVTRLGRNVATWGMYVPAEVYFPAGVLKYDRV